MIKSIIVYLKKIVPYKICDNCLSGSLWVDINLTFYKWFCMLYIWNFEKP